MTVIFGNNTNGFTSPPPGTVYFSDGSTTPVNATVSAAKQLTWTDTGASTGSPGGGYLGRYATPTLFTGFAGKLISSIAIAEAQVGQFCSSFAFVRKFNSSPDPATCVSYGSLNFTELTFTDATGLSSMSVGDSCVSVGGTANGIIDSIDIPNKKIRVGYPGAATWAVGEKLKDTSVTSIPPAPTTTPPDALKYAAITGSPITVSSAPFTTVNLPQANLATGQTYYARVQYDTTNAAAATSSFSGWSSFAT
jgi:hypothetical protein